MVEFVPPNICDHTVTYMSQQSKGGVRRDKLIAKREKADHIATLSKIATHEARAHTRYEGQHFADQSDDCDFSTQERLNVGFVS